VDRRKEELKDEIETAILQQYYAQDAAIATAQAEVAELFDKFLRDLRDIGQRLKQERPELMVQASRNQYGGATNWGFAAVDKNRAQERQALLAKIPNQVGDAKLTLDRQELDMLRELAAGALESEEAQQFLARIPTIGQLIPRVVLAELESNL
jgi:hypothetical protein